MVTVTADTRNKSHAASVDACACAVREEESLPMLIRRSRPGAKDEVCREWLMVRLSPEQLLLCPKDKTQ